MFGDTITLFNFHEPTSMWYAHTISGCDCGITAANTATTQNGITKSDNSTLIIPCSSDKVITTVDSEAEYCTPKKYTLLSDPENYITFQPETDFFVVGEYNGSSSVSDEDYEDGFYDYINSESDDVFMVASAAFYGMIPHFEIGGR
jgi:hypothetical protein